MKPQDIEALPRVSQLKLDRLAAKELIADRRHWCQNMEHQYDNAGKVIAACSTGALRMTLYYYSSRYDDAHRALLKAIPGSAFIAASVERFNDSHSHAEVMMLWDRAIAAA